MILQACQTGGPIEALLRPFTMFFFPWKPKTYLHVIVNFLEIYQKLIKLATFGNLN